jgi:hypothetical protein
LEANKSPAMKTNFKAYIFPNEDEKSSSSCSSFVGITFTEPINESQAVLFEDVLINLGSLIYQDKNSSTGVKRPSIQIAPPPLIPSQQNEEFSKMKLITTDKEENKIKETEGLSADSIARGLVSGAEYISQGLGTATEYGSKYIHTGSEALKAKLKPNDEATKVSPTIKTMTKGVRYGTKCGVRVSSYLINKLSSISSATAKKVAPPLRSASSNILSKSGIVSDKESANNYVDNVCKVAGSGIESFGIVYDSLEQAAKVLGKNFTEKTVVVMEHKYGEDVGEVTENTLYSVGNVANSYHNVKNLKIFRTVAKSTAKEIIKPSETKNKE